MCKIIKQILKILKNRKRGYILYKIFAFKAREIAQRLRCCDQIPKNRSLRWGGFIWAQNSQSTAHHGPKTGQAEDGL